MINFNLNKRYDNKLSYTNCVTNLNVTILFSNKSKDLIDK